MTRIASITKISSCIQKLIGGDIQDDGLISLLLFFKNNIGLLIKCKSYRHGDPKCSNVLQSAMD
jgi:hypothetical protein